MAFKYSRGTRFDDKLEETDDSRWDVKDAFEKKEKWYKALQGITNRQLGTTSGTGYLPTLAVVADGTTCGIKTTNLTAVVINGQIKSCAAKDNVDLPYPGTLAAGHVAKFLIHTDDAGTDVVVSGPGNKVLASDYASYTLAHAAAKLPDLPAGRCALGYLTLDAPAATDVTFMQGAVIGTTGGTSTYTQLVTMPYDG